MNRELVFYSLLDFYPRKDIIKTNYELLTLDEKISYKLYVYSIPFEEEYIKDLMWEFLNGWNEGMFLLGKHYRRKKQKNDKRQEQYDKEVENEIQHNVKVR